MSVSFPTPTNSSSSSSSSSISSSEFAPPSSAEKPSYIIVYDKSGVNEFCRTATYQQIQNLVDDRFYRVEYYSQAPHAIQDTRSNPVSLFVIPGGDFTKMNDELKPLVVKIQDLVKKDGAGYLGICAGAIAAAPSLLSAFPNFDYSEGLIQMDDWAYDDIEITSLNLYSENCASWTPTAFRPSYSAQQVYQPGTPLKLFNVYFRQGVFFPHNNTTKIRTLLAFTGQFYGAYRNAKVYHTEQPAAAIAEKVGNGTIVLSGVHPEIGAEIVTQFPVNKVQEGTTKSEVVKKIIANQEAQKSKVVQELQPYKNEQTDLMRHYLDTLAIATKKTN